MFGNSQRIPMTSIYSAQYSATINSTAIAKFEQTHTLPYKDR